MQTANLVTFLAAEGDPGVQTDNIIQWVVTLIAVLTAVFAIIRDRRKPTLDLANSDQVKATIKQMTDKSNAARDLRVLELENWGFNELRPWGRDVVVRDDLMVELIRRAYKQLDMPMPEIPPLRPMPEMPHPRPLGEAG